LDSKNPDGSYTYGFESGDGTYKIETRLADGTVKGKYAYIDPNGVLRETAYGGSADGGFQPEIDGVVVAPPTLVDEADLQDVQSIFVAPAPVEERPARAGSRFANFKANNFRNVQASQTVDNKNIRIVNGRRAILKKRLRVNPSPAPRAITLRPEVQRQQFQRSREQELRALDAEKQALLRLHRQRYNGITGAANPREQSRSLSFQQRQFQPQQQIQQQILPQQNSVYETHPYITGYNPSDGSYSLSY
jgi:hypothetical protein